MGSFLKIDFEVLNQKALFFAEKGCVEIFKPNFCEEVLRRKVYPKESMLEKPLT